MKKEEALLKLQRYCAYQERCRQEVRRKLNELEVDEKDHQKIIGQLEDQGFLKEERFVEVFVNGRFKIKKWGRFKITQALKEKGISGKLIQKGLAEINEKDYIKTLKELMKKKLKETHIKDPFQKKDKVAKYLINKGYEPDLVWDHLK